MYKTACYHAVLNHFLSSCVLYNIKTEPYETIQFSLFHKSLPRRHTGRAEVQLQSFLTLVLDGGKLPILHPSHFNPTKEPCYSVAGTLEQANKLLIT